MLTLESHKVFFGLGDKTDQQSRGFRLCSGSLSKKQALRSSCELLRTKDSKLIQN